MIRGLYAVTPDEADTDLLLAKVEAALQGGISMLQYRNKLADHKLQTQQALLKSIFDELNWGPFPFI